MKEVFWLSAKVFHGYIVASHSCAEDNILSFKNSPSGHFFIEY